jgi:hypothetical protein
MPSAVGRGHREDLLAAALEPRVAGLVRLRMIANADLEPAGDQAADAAALVPVQGGRCRGGRSPPGRNASGRTRTAQA